MESHSPLEDLPGQLTTFARKIPEAGRLVTAASVGRWTLPPGLAEVNYLSAARIGLRLFFARSGTTTIFFIFHKDAGTWVMLEAVVSLALRAASVAEPAPVLTTEDVRRLIKVPSFLWLDVTQDEAAAFGPPGATRLNTIFLRLGDGGRNVLAIKNPEAGKKATLRYSPGGAQGPVEPAGGKYSLRPFIDMALTLRDWLAQGQPASVTLESSGPPADEEPVHRVLTKLLQAYVDSNNALAPGDFPDDTPPPLRQHYRISSYEVTLKMRLKADGTLAQQEKEEAFQLAADLKLSEEPPRTAAVTLGPPDFLVSGPLYDAFFGELQTPLAVDSIAGVMHINPGFVRPFLASARPASAIFRVSRGPDHDKDILLLPGELFGEPTTLVVEAEFLVNAKKEPPSVALVNAAPRVITLKGGDPGSFQVNYDDAEYFLLLALTIRLWVRVLGEW